MIITTSISGRGVDIQLGGNLELRLAAELEGIEDESARAAKEAEIRAEIDILHDEVIAAGGLFVIGTERHESRRIDNQLRGRSGRQGDPGTSRFFLSLEDDLMRIFGSERMDGMLQKLGIEEGEAIVHPWINKALEKAQQKVEARNFDIRKQLLQYDDVMNDQRKVIYEQRKDLMQIEDVSETIKSMREEVLDDLIGRTIPERAFAEQWDTTLLQEEAQRVFSIDIPAAEWAKEEGIADEEIRDRMQILIDANVAAKTVNYGADLMRMAEKNLLLQILDQYWKDHLLRLDHLRQGIGLRAFGQKNPLNEYKREAFDMFQDMLGRLREGVTQLLSHIEIQVNPHRHANRACHGRPVRRRSACRCRSPGPHARPQRSSRQDRPERPRHMGQGLAQHRLPVRQRQEVQTLPRQAGLGTRRSHDRVRCF